MFSILTLQLLKYSFLVLEKLSYFLFLIMSVFIPYKLLSYFLIANGEPVQHLVFTTLISLLPLLPFYLFRALKEDFTKSINSLSNPNSISHSKSDANDNEERLNKRENQLNKREKSLRDFEIDLAHKVDKNNKFFATLKKKQEAEIQKYALEYALKLFPEVKNFNKDNRKTGSDH